MLHDISWPMSGLLVAWCTSLLYGMSIIVTAGYMKIMLLRGLKTVTSRVLLIVALVQFIIATAHVAVSLRQAIDGLLNSPDATLYFADQNSPQHIAQTTLYVTNNLIADGVLVWRLYVVWNRNKRLCIPLVMMTIASAVAGYVDVIKLTTVSSDKVLFSIAIRQWAVAAWSLSIGTQVSASLLIAWKVWYTHIGTVGFSTNQRSMPIMCIVLESGAILSLSHVFLLAMYVERTVAGSVIVAMIGQLDALVPTSILLRAVITTDVQHNMDNPPAQPPSWRSLTQHRSVSIGMTPVGLPFDKGRGIYETNEPAVPRSVYSVSSDV